MACHEVHVPWREGFQRSIRLRSSFSAGEGPRGYTCMKEFSRFWWVTVLELLFLFVQGTGNGCKGRGWDKAELFFMSPQGAASDWRRLLSSVSVVLVRDEQTPEIL